MIVEENNRKMEEARKKLVGGVGGCSSQGSLVMLGMLWLGVQDVLFDDLHYFFIKLNVGSNVIVSFIY